MSDKPLSFVIAGSGTAGLLSAIMLRAAFRHCQITVISSSDIGIVGVGEGSTEHWRNFMERCEIPLLEMLAETKATHKYGLRFENWSEAFPDYFHSVSGDEDVFMWRLYPVYSELIRQGKPLTQHTGGLGLFTDQIRKETLHNSTNQFHFDTFKLNSYFTSVAQRRRIGFIDGIINQVNLSNTNGNIESVTLQSGQIVSGDFWIDATGFRRVLMTALGNTDWKSFSKYLLCDSAIAFPTASDTNGKIRTYTRARARSSGWMWEIPTQERRGNGYVYSSQFITDEDARLEASEAVGIEVQPARSFRFDAGHLAKAWVNNCCAVGLASAFVEPIEATSIGGTIQQLERLVPFVGSYEPHHWASQRAYNKSFNTMMDNILTMVRLHYISDRRDTPFWRAMAEMPVNDTLQELLDLWQETTLPRDFIQTNNGEMFQIAHLLHIAQGQNVINTGPLGNLIKNFDVYDLTLKDIANRKHARMSDTLVDHKEALDEIYN